MKSDGTTRGESVSGVHDRPALLPSALKSEWLFGDKGAATLPLTIPGDADRVLLAFYATPSLGQITLAPLLGAGEAIITLGGSNCFLELRLTTHGTTTQDSWIVDSPGGGTVCILKVSKEGGY